MLNFKYISSRGNEYDLITKQSMITECNAFDYQFVPVTFGKRFGAKIYGFEMEMKEFEATFYVFGESRKDYINKIIADFDYDVQTENEGTFVCNGYEIKGFSIGGSEASNNADFFLWDTFKRKFICLYPFWSKQTAFEMFISSATEPTFTDIKDYMPVSENGKADYPWDYMTHVGKNGSFRNEDINGSEYQIIINGYAVNPIIQIGDLYIALNLVVSDNEFVTIDSRNKTITLTTASGIVEDVFGYRDVSIDIFKKIPKGNSTVFWDDESGSDFSWTLATFDERTTPPWK